MRKRTPKAINVSWNKEVTDLQIMYCAYSCDRMAKDFFWRAIESESQEESDGLWEKKWEMEDLRDQLLDFLKPEYVFWETLQDASDDGSNYPPLQIDVCFLHYHVGCFHLDYMTFEPPYGNWESFSERPDSKETPEGFPLASKELCERLLELLP